jgi:hypothetical protein
MHGVWPFGHVGSVLLSVVAQAGFSFSLFRWCRCLLSVGSPDFPKARFRAGTVVGVELPKRSSPLGRGECPYVVEINASAKMFYLLNHLLLLHLVNLKPKCNNLTLTLSMVLYASYVCFMHSRFIENPPIDLEVMKPSFLRWFCHNHKLGDPYVSVEEAWFAHKYNSKSGLFLLLSLIH